MIIRGIEACSFIDYPKKISCVLFTELCSFDCFYCHNRQLLEKGAAVINEQELKQFLFKRKKMLDAVVISGGEPTLHTDLAQLLRFCKSLGYATKVDTNGSNPVHIQRLLDEGLLSYVALDIKASAQKYRSISGGEAGEVLSTLKCLHEYYKSSSAFSYEIRTTLAPGIDIQELLAIAQSVPLVPKWTLNLYRLPSLYKNTDRLRVHAKALNKEQVEKFIPLLQKFQPRVCIS